LRDRDAETEVECVPDADPRRENVEQPDAEGEALVDRDLVTVTETVAVMESV
jgi:hypothetical protein